MIYLPMLLTILSNDREIVENGSYKIKGPYLKLIDQAIDRVQIEIKTTQDYMRSNKLKLIKGKTEDTFTTYIFVYHGREDQRRYLNARLKNRTEELLEYFLGI
ncbi:hypothetical protein H9649_07355 [Sporosarcina sp. Sa2YVA2]|uniref:Uncharacterized protein n=2 Tax=Sporosarcina quadrami TaxID=2762234 RepID=A0ABR8U9B4_9BACL|nr:hypothetical protein [Sporosarcina quadrami]